MHWRSIRLKVLIGQGVVYRVFIILNNTLFFWILTGQFKLAISVSLLWNVINMVLYYFFHYIWARLFKLGKEVNMNEKAILKEGSQRPVGHLDEEKDEG